MRQRIDRSHDIPYLAGYSQNGRTIYIDRSFPRAFVARGQRVFVDRFLAVHERTEKALLDALGLTYPQAHRLALRAEKEAVRAAGVPWNAYRRFMQKHIRRAARKPLARVPRDLDLKPYRDSKDFALLRRMRAARL